MSLSSRRRSTSSMWASIVGVDAFSDTFSDFFRLNVFTWEHCSTFGLKANCWARFLLAILKYPFYYTIRRGFGNFFGMVHVLTRHLAPELDRFRFVLDFGACCILTGNWTFLEMFWRMVTTGLRWGIRGRFNTRKMGPKGARKGPGRPAWSPWAGQPSPFRSPIGLGFLQHEVCVNPNLCFTKTTDYICL